jgi:hypothetical protein
VGKKQLAKKLRVQKVKGSKVQKEVGLVTYDESKEQPCLPAGRLAKKLKTRSI